MKEEKKLVPKLRFPEFRWVGAWAVPQLGSIGSFTGGGTPSKDKADYWTGENPWVSSSDISEDGIQNISISRYISDEAIQATATKVVPANSILIVSRVGVGKLAISRAPICTSQDFTSFTPARDDLVFLAYCIKSLKAKLLAFNQGMAIKGFTKDDVSNLGIPLPALAEQQKISDCLSSLDELIAAQARKVDALKTHKEGLMQQLFPREGETQPRLRFPEFQNAGAWEQRKLGSLFEIGGGRDYKHLGPGEIPVYGSGGYMLSVNNFLHDGESVCIGRKGTIDRPMFLSGKFWTVDTLFFTRSFKHCIPKFMFSIFENIEWRKHNEAGGVPGLSKTIIEKIETAVPSIPEQQRIADCLTSLDDLITAATQELETLKTHKKALMQQLFPSAEAVEA